MGLAYTSAALVPSFLYNHKPTAGGTVRGQIARGEKASSSLDWRGGRHLSQVSRMSGCCVDKNLEGMEEQRTPDLKNLHDTKGGVGNMLKKHKSLFKTVHLSIVITPP